MTYRDAQGQLGLDQPDTTVKPKRIADGRPSGAVIGFVDASTRAIREEAIKRVKASGIFPAPEQRKR